MPPTLEPTAGDPMSEPSHPQSLPAFTVVVPAFDEEGGIGEYMSKS